MRPLARDSMALGLLLVLALVLVSVYGKGVGAGLTGSAEGPGLADRGFYLNNIAGQMASMYLLMAMGFALCLRCGVIDLSVWMAASLGGVAAARALGQHLPLPVAFAAAVGAGLGLGAINGLLVGRAKVPGPLATGATAVGVMWLLRALCRGGEIAVAPGSFNVLASMQEFKGEETLPLAPLLVARMLIVALAYAIVMFLLVLGGSGRVRASRRWQSFAALLVSGGLGGLGGACWLIDRSVATVPTFPIGDLRVVAASLLAGAALLGGRNRTLLVGVALPAAMLVATAWRQEVWSVPLWGWPVQMLLLIGMTLVTHWAIEQTLRWRQQKRWLSAAAAILTACGLVVMAGSAGIESARARLDFHFLSLLLWLAGTALLLLSKHFSRRAKARVWV
jgi:ribose/xylose/arabinose/galactoside ABC-type transport system permease subunit